jgi:hypothetical protein
MRAKEAGYKPDFSVGNVVGRGFADLGVELFEILPADKILSLYTGKLANFAPEDRDRFFQVPSVDAVVDRIERSGDRVFSISQLKSRDWRVQLDSGEVFEGPSIEEAVLGAFVSLVSLNKLVKNA